jgi:hypothetical protein
MSEPLYDEAKIASIDDTTSRVLLGGALSDLNGVTEQQTLPQLTATAYYGGIALGVTP